MSRHESPARPEEERSEFGDVFSGTEAQAAYTAEGTGTAPAEAPRRPESTQGVVRDAGGSVRGWGNGPIPRDPRKFRYDTTRARTAPAVKYGASKADRMDATAAGDMLHRIHVMFGIDKEDEARILAFDKALWLEHSINGASMLQPGRGELTVGDMSFDIAPVKLLLGEEQRRFFRAYADDIADTNREVLRSYDMYDAETVEKVGQLRQVAVERGLQKYPHLAHDSSDACVSISMEERLAVMQSKRLVIPTLNQVDALPAARASPAVGTAQSSLA